MTVNGLLPKNLARKMSSYELGDDFSKSARNIDLDSASVTVTIDGKDANSLFDVHKQDGRVWITAKQPLLDTTYNQAADRKVRMTIKGAFAKGVLKAGQKVQLTNGDWEKWNQQTVPGNEPPVREWSPNPDKSWIKLGDDGTWQAVVDPDETNKTGADTQKFLDGDQVASVVNGVIASGSRQGHRHQADRRLRQGRLHLGPHVRQVEDPRVRGRRHDRRGILRRGHREQGP